MLVLVVGQRCSVVLQVGSPVTSGRLVAPPSVPTAWTRLLDFDSCVFFLFFCLPLPDIPLLLVPVCGKSFLFFLSVFVFFVCLDSARVAVSRPLAVMMKACIGGMTPLDAQARPHMGEAPRAGATQRTDRTTPTDHAQES